MRKRSCGTRAGRLGGVGAVLALALVVGGCGAADDAAENALEKGLEKGLEKAAEGDGVADVDLDADAGELTITGEDGGTLTTGGDDLPEGFPDNVPFPEDYSILMGLSDPETEEIVLVVQSSAGIDEIREQLEEGFSANGYEVEEVNSMEAEAMRSVTLEATDGSIQVTSNLQRSSELTRVQYMVQASE